VIAAAPNRTDRVNDVAGRQTVAARQPRLARRAAADGAAFLKQFGARRAVDRAIDPAAAEQRGIRRVDDGVGREPCDVALLQANAIAKRIPDG
jgi:hypothetical protein